VQWHPEELTSETSTRLFVAFIAACKATKDAANDIAELPTIARGTQ